MASDKKSKVYICRHCGARTLKWQGQCFQCGQWGALQAIEEVQENRQVRTEGRAFFFG